MCSLFVIISPKMRTTVWNNTTIFLSLVALSNVLLFTITLWFCAVIHLLNVSVYYSVTPVCVRLLKTTFLIMCHINFRYKCLWFYFKTIQNIILDFLIWFVPHRHSLFYLVCVTEKRSHFFVVFIPRSRVYLLVFASEIIKERLKFCLMLAAIYSQKNMGVRNLVSTIISYSAKLLCNIDEKRKQGRIWHSESILQGLLLYLGTLLHLLVSQLVCLLIYTAWSAYELSNWPL